MTTVASVRDDPQQEQSKVRLNPYHSPHLEICKLVNSAKDVLHGWPNKLSIR